MNTTIADLSKFTAALVSGNGLSPASRAEMTKPQLHITTAHQFPMFGADLPPESAAQRPPTPAWASSSLTARKATCFYKGGHDGQTANTLVCLNISQRCALILSNDVRSEAGFAELVLFLLGETPRSLRLGVRRLRRKILSLWHLYKYRKIPGAPPSPGSCLSG